MERSICRIYSNTFTTTEYGLINLGPHYITEEYNIIIIFAFSNTGHNIQITENGGYWYGTVRTSDGNIARSVSCLIYYLSLYIPL